MAAWLRVFAQTIPVNQQRQSAQQADKAILVGNVCEALVHILAEMALRCCQEVKT